MLLLKFSYTLKLAFSKPERYRLLELEAAQKTYYRKTSECLHEKMLYRVEVFSTILPLGE